MNTNYELVSTGTPYTGLLFRIDFVGYGGAYFYEIYVIDDGLTVTLQDDSGTILYNSTEGWTRSNVYGSYDLIVTSVDDTSYPNASTIISYFTIGEIKTNNFYQQD